ncbi:hypothetical protein AB4138_17880 [Vibrio sp. 10N.286.52.C3]|uniref:hypothetical protein n=1 Tax=Vibrio sp. 10N.286.52.C3 TaxID=3229713 RepID=UPI00354C7A36
MTLFFAQSQTVEVSRLSRDGWWLENTSEHVVKGTALGEDFTQDIYTPSSKGMIAQYDRGNKTWSEEIEDMTWKTFWDKNGNDFVIGKPNGDYPQWVIKDMPPEYNKDTQTVLHSDKMGWVVHEILLGRCFYDKWGNEFLVSDYNFELPSEHSWEGPPKPEEGRAFKLVHGEWVSFADHREKMAYAKDRDNNYVSDYQIDELGELPNTHTLLEYGPYDSWSGDKSGWQYDITRHRPYKADIEKVWRDAEFSRVLNRIDQYERDQNYPSELRTSPLTIEQYNLLLLDRKLLSDYPNIEGFPFCERPRLSGLAT